MTDSAFQNNSVFFVETTRINPNPFQPRKEFNEDKLSQLADSIRMYGVLQPLVVTRKEVEKEDGGLETQYELIAGERRLRASKIAGLSQVPVLIRSQEDDDQVKLELAIIENLQREDINAIDRAKAFAQLANQFGLKHGEIAKKVGRSREYVSNSIRLLSLPENMQQALQDGKISEGHSRTLLMLCDKPQEQEVLFKEITVKGLTVRDAEKISRKIAYDKVRKKERMFDPEIVELEEQLSTSLGTRVHIEKKNIGGKIEIDFFSNDDVRKILDLLKTQGEHSVDETMKAYLAETESEKREEARPDIPEDRKDELAFDNDSKAEIDPVGLDDNIEAEIDTPRITIDDANSQDSFSSSEAKLAYETIGIENQQKPEENEDKDNNYNLDHFSL